MVHGSGLCEGKDRQRLFNAPGQLINAMKTGGIYREDKTAAPPRGSQTQLYAAINAEEPVRELIGTFRVRGDRKAIVMREEVANGLCMLARDLHQQRTNWLMRKP